MDGLPCKDDERDVQIWDNTDSDGVFFFFLLLLLCFLELPEGSLEGAFVLDYLTAVFNVENERYLGMYVIMIDNDL